MYFLVLLSIFEFIFYTFFMVLVSLINIKSLFLKNSLTYLSLFLVSLILYYLLRAILRKINMPAEKNLYIIPILNIIISFSIATLLVKLFPKNIGTSMIALLIYMSLIYYGILINLIICILNFFFTKSIKSRKKT